MARPTESGRSRAARSSPLTFRRFGRAINTDEVFGTHSYAEFLEAIADPNHERHRELKEWFADDFNPHVLDVDWLAEDVAALAERWSRQPAVKRRRTA